MNRATSLGELVTRRPTAAQVLESFDLDYCCGGSRTLADACMQAGIDPLVVEEALAACDDDLTVPEWATLGPAALADHVQRVHHEYLAAELPRLRSLTVKVHTAHVERHPELDAVVDLLDALHDDLVPHLSKEDVVLFPMIRELAAADAPAELHCGSIANPIRVMLAEHEHAGEILARLRAVTFGYGIPADACVSYRALSEGLHALDRDVRLHVHKESNVLFPAVLRLEARWSVGRAPGPV